MRLLLILLSMIVLGGCASGSLLSDVTKALVHQQFGLAEDPIATAKLNPMYRYLRVQVEGKPAALLVLGYVDAHPQGDIEVWYSAQHEVLKIQNGRIVGTAGLDVDWRAVRFSSPLPAWNFDQPLPQTFRRWRDEMPGYRFSVTDQLTLQRAPDLPPLALPSSLPVTLAQSYSWFQESSSASDDAVNPLPTSWFALQRSADGYHVAYSFQCLSSHYCLSLQSWPPKDAGA